MPHNFVLHLSYQTGLISSPRKPRIKCPAGRLPPMRRKTTWRHSPFTGNPQLYPPITILHIWLVFVHSRASLITADSYARHYWLSDITFRYRVSYACMSSFFLSFFSYFEEYAAHAEQFLVTEGVIRWMHGTSRPS